MLLSRLLRTEWHVTLANLVTMFSFCEVRDISTTDDEISPLSTIHWV